MKKKHLIPQPWRLSVEELRTFDPLKSYDQARALKAIATLEQLCLIASELRLVEYHIPNNPLKPNIR
jgi:hypothetical protein